MAAVVPYQPSQPVTFPCPTLVPASPSSIVKVNQLAVAIKEKLQPCPFKTEHLVHGGIYTRTVRLPDDAVCAAVLYKVPSTLIIEGDCDVFDNGDLMRVSGYTVLPGCAGRKIAFVTRSAVKMSMMFATSLTDVAEIQKQFTDEWELLVPLSKADEHVVLITGE
jgi:hypothetical protein